MYEPGQMVQCKLADPMMRPVGERLVMNVVSVEGDLVTVTWADRDHSDRMETFAAEPLEPVPVQS